VSEAGFGGAAAFVCAGMRGGDVGRHLRYMLDRVLPVAEQYNVQLACHLDDPPAPVLRGVERWNWPVFEGLKAFSELSDSPMHGFNLCCVRARMHVL
jgi:mannonate dehydratase